MTKPIFDLYQLNQDLISANTKIVHLYAQISWLNTALGMSQAQLKNRNERIFQLREVLGNLVDSAEEALDDQRLEEDSED
jgi:nitrogen fixation/metabolism regulation signal transduction histidine kinase